MADLTDFIRDVKSRVRISDVVGRHVELNRRGSLTLGLCPFHNEKTPSFTVRDDAGFYHCFGCGASGDHIKFLREIEGIEFIAAVKQLADMAGMAMPELQKETAESRDRRKKRETEREVLLRLHQEAMAFFQASFRQSKLARDYAARRGLTREAIEQFGIGYAPSGWNGLMEHLTAKGATVEMLRLGGLVSTSQREGTGHRHHDRFRNRLIFPICDPQGRPIAFGARAIDPADEPKYLNSPETPIYRKSETLYGLHIARPGIREASRAVLLEGYMDVIAMWQGGFRNALASCGTAFTRPQAAQIARLTREVAYLYDGDDAGQKAMLRGSVELLTEGLVVKVVSLPAEHDPDSFLQDPATGGAPALKKRLDEAEDAFRYFLRASMTRHGAGTVEGRVRIGQEMIDLLASVSTVIARSNYARLLSDIIGVSVEEIEAETGRRAEARLRQEELARQRQSAAEAPIPPSEGSDPVPEIPIGMRGKLAADDDHDVMAGAGGKPPARLFGGMGAERPVDPAERALLRLALACPELRPTLQVELPLDWLEDPGIKGMIEAIATSPLPPGELLDAVEQGKLAFPAALATLGAAAIASQLRATLVWREEDFRGSSPMGMLQHLLLTLRKRSLRRHQHRLFQSIRTTESKAAEASLRDFTVHSLDYYSASGEYYGGARQARERRLDSTPEE